MSPSWDEIAGELASRLGLARVPPVHRRWMGATSVVLEFGSEFAVKIPHDNDEAVQACLRHVDVSVAVAKLGVAAPEILMVVDRNDLGMDVPIIVSRMMGGDSLTPGDANEGVWRRVGEELLLIHSASVEQVPAGLRRYMQSPADDLAVVIAELVGVGRLHQDDAARLLIVRDRLYEMIGTGFSPVFCHGDMHTGNVIAAHGQFAGLIDFAGAGWLDSAWDFAGIPLAAVRAAVAGYTATGIDESALPRIAWCRLQLALDRRRQHTNSRDLDVDHLLKGVDTLLG